MAAHVLRTTSCEIFLAVSPSCCNKKATRAANHWRCIWVYIVTQAYNGTGPRCFPLFPLQSDRPCYRGRQLCAMSINYDLIKNWLQDCEGRHKRCRLETPRHRPTKVIDCLQRKIILTTPDTKDFPFSCVWGALMGNIVAPKLSPGDEHLPEDIPRLIADAMTLVVSLGYKHLWFDRWCIDQGNKEETP